MLCLRWLRDGRPSPAVSSPEPVSLPAGLWTTKGGHIVRIGGLGLQGGVGVVGGAAWLLPRRLEAPDCLPTCPPVRRRCGRTASGLAAGPRWAPSMAYSR